MSEELDQQLQALMLDQAPMPILCLNSADQVIWLNEAASDMGFKEAQAFGDCMPDIDAPVTDKIRFEPTSTVYRLIFPHHEKRCQIKWVQQDDQLLLWISDVTEKLAIANRVREGEQPGIRKFRQLNQLATTASGYSELLDVVLEDEHLIADKLTAVRQYQAEVSRSLNAMLDVLHGDKTPAERTGTIIVADAHQDLANLISELLRTEGYRTESFTDAGSVLSYLKMNADRVSGAVLDEDLTADDGSLIQAIGQLNLKINVFTLSHCDNAESEGKIAKPVDFEVLLRKLQSSENAN